VSCSAVKNETCLWAPYHYPPTAENMTVPWFDINLDLPPQDRWTAIVTPWAKQMQAVIDQVTGMLPAKLRAAVEKLISKDEAYIFAKFGAEYAGELKGIATATGIDLQWITAMQLMYEITGMCTSIVAQDTMGNIYHARNLDFGLFDGYTFKNDSWLLTDKLRPVLFNGRWMKAGVNIFNTTSFAGFIGLLTGAKQGGFSMSVDSRFDENFDKYLLEWIENKYNGSELCLTLRNIMMNATNYADALSLLQTTDFIGPAYIIIGGIAVGEGAVVTRTAVKSIDLWTLQQQLDGGSFYVVETNYDHWKPPLPIDNRRTPAEICLNTTGQANINLPTLFNVLSARPVRNQLTSQTVLMQPQIGRYEAYKQYCEVPCAPW